MNTMSDDTETLVADIKKKIEDYESTIRASQSFISLVTWENSHKLETAIFSIGRRMTTSDENRLSCKDVITPDIVIQRQPDLGYVVEVKKSLPKDLREWEETVKQIIKYDDELAGWWNPPDETISVQCVVLLIHYSRSRNFSDYFQEYIRKYGIRLKNKVSIVEFSRSDENNPFFALRKEYGEILDKKVSDKLYSGTEVPIEKVIVSYGNQKFNDCEPPAVEYTMAILWQDIFNSMRGKNIDRKNRVYPIDVSVEKITDELQKLYGAKGNSHRDVEYPQIGWVRAAMNAFVERGYAVKIDDDNYCVLFRLIRDDPLSYFIKNQKTKETDGKLKTNQLPLF